MPFGIYVDDPKARFSAAHFLFDHNKCSRIHGHNYNVRVRLEGNLNDQKFVVDFFVLKEQLRKIAEELDHAILLPEKSQNMKIIKHGSKILVDMGQKHFEFPESDVRLLPLEATTAELFSQYFYGRLKSNYPQFRLIVEVGETDGNIAYYTE
jgi:6-pyruvoyltetrahydropterin/6-carboxytetrahydropterin synthase